MRLNLAFDHRVIDGAEAADVLADIKAGLEAFAGQAASGPPAPARPALTGEKAHADGGGR
jgi:hypothetical protein